MISASHNPLILYCTVSVTTGTCVVRNESTENYVPCHARHVHWMRLDQEDHSIARTNNHGREQQPTKQQRR